MSSGCYLLFWFQIFSDMLCLKDRVWRTCLVCDGVVFVRSVCVCVCVWVECWEGWVIALRLMLHHTATAVSVVLHSLASTQLGALILVSYSHLQQCGHSTNITVLDKVLDHFCTWLACCLCANLTLLTGMYVFVCESCYWARAVKPRASWFISIVSKKIVLGSYIACWVSYNAMH